MQVTPARPAHSRPRAAHRRRARRRDSRDPSRARLVLGGARPAGLPRGYFVAPTIFDRVAPTPASPARRCSARSSPSPASPAEAEALAIANGTGYGLVAGVYTHDISRALRLAKQLEAGSVWINGWFIGGQQAPTGGIKDSGIGRERGLPGVRNYLQIKNVGIRHLMLPYRRPP